MLSANGQQIRGSDHHFSKLSEDDVHKIRYLLEQRRKLHLMLRGLTLEAIGRRFSVKKNAIYHISKRNSWGHLKEE